jgi:hypothetical protein
MKMLLLLTEQMIEELRESSILSTILTRLE